MTTITPEIRDFVKKSIEENQIIVFSKSYCPHCLKTKVLLDSLNVDYKVIELDIRLEGDAIQKTLLELTNQRTVPNIFINQKHVGGNDALHAAHESGKLADMLKLQAKL